MYYTTIQYRLQCGNCNKIIPYGIMSKSEKLKKYYDKGELGNMINFGEDEKCPNCGSDGCCSVLEFVVNNIVYDMSRPDKQGKIGIYAAKDENGILNGDIIADRDVTVIEVYNAVTIILNKFRENIEKYSEEDANPEGIYNIWFRFIVSIHEGDPFFSGGSGMNAFCSRIQIENILESIREEYRKKVNDIFFLSLI